MAAGNGRAAGLPATAKQLAAAPVMARTPVCRRGGWWLDALFAGSPSGAGCPIIFRPGRALDTGVLSGFACAAARQFDFCAAVNGRSQLGWLCFADLAAGNVFGIVDGGCTGTAVPLARLAGTAVHAAIGGIGCDTGFRLRCHL